MNVLQNLTHILTNIITFFGVQGGTAPYVFSIEPGGAGGTIDANTGEYTAPSSISTDAQETVDTITVTDSLGLVESSSIFICAPLELLCDIIRKEMELENDQVYIFDQKYTMPNDSRVYVTVGVLSEKPFSRSNRIEEIGGVFSEISTANFRSILSVNVQSKSTEALYRNVDAMIALNSNYSRTQQEANNFYIAPLSDQINNISEIDGSGIPYRFNFGATMQYSKIKVKSITYYDTFEKPSVTTE